MEKENSNDNGGGIGMTDVWELPHRKQGAFASF